MKSESLATLKLTFFTTLGCHLCEQAEQLLHELQPQHGLTWRSVDISSDVSLVERYGIRIPVLKNDVTGDELGWPFDFLSLEEFLASSAD